MEFKQTLDEFKIAINKELNHYFDIAIRDAGKHDLLIERALGQAKKIALSGGKRIRGSLLQCAYFGVGGREKKKILKVAVAIEFLHLFFLVHDDIIDRGQLRHGQQPLHRFFAKKANNSSELLKSEQFGNSVAIIVGDMFFAKANEIILQAGFGKKETLEALTYLQNVVKMTIIGQSQDIAIENSKKVSQSDVLRMYENKTAKYTFEGPLLLGMIFAGVCDKKIKNIFSRYARAIGKAYQLQDDTLGIFGKERKIGKSTVSDIEEGKLSLMLIYARAKAKAGDLKTLNGIFAKKGITQKETQFFKEILIKTGARKYAHDLTKRYFEIGKKEIEKASLILQSKNFLLGLVEYLEEREV